MKSIRYFCMFLVFPICLLFTSCHLFNNNGNIKDNDLKESNSDEYGEMYFNRILDNIEKKDRNGLMNLFSNKVSGKIGDLKTIDDLFEFYSGTRESVEYNYSTEVDIFEDSIHYKFYECLAYVKTADGNYRFEYLLCKNDDCEGLISFVISTEESGKSSRYSKYITNMFTEAEYLNEECFGIFIFN